MSSWSDPKGEHERELRSVLDTAGFRALPIPPELQHEPEQVRAELDRRKLELAQQLQHEMRISAPVPTNSGNNSSSRAAS